MPEADEDEEGRLTAKDRLVNHGLVGKVCRRTIHFSKPDLDAEKRLFLLDSSEAGNAQRLVRKAATIMIILALTTMSFNFLFCSRFNHN